MANLIIFLALILVVFFLLLYFVFPRLLYIGALLYHVFKTRNKNRKGTSLKYKLGDLKEVRGKRVK